MKLESQVAVVTGASRGIGRAICEAFAAEGATTVACARSADALESLAAKVRQSGAGGKVIPKTVDVTDRAALDALVDWVGETFERIDVLVNNAGITRDTLLMSMEDEAFDEVIRVNLRSVFLLTRAVCKYMVRARRGRIINISSVSGVMGNAGQSNYAASKAGVIAFTKSVAKEVGRRGITCNVIAPGFVNTEMTRGLPDKLKEDLRPLIPLQRFGEPEEVAGVAVFLASPESRYITGQVIQVDGGLNT